MAESSISKRHISLEELEVPFRTPNPSPQAPLFAILACAIVSVAYSEGTKISVEYMDPLISKEAINVALQLDSMSLISDLYAQLRDTLDGHQRTSQNVDQKAMDGTHDIPRTKSRLPRILITVEMSEETQRRVGEGEYDLALALMTTTDADLYKLVACTKSSAVDQQVYATIQRVRNLIPQLALSKDTRICDLDLICASDRSQLAIWNELMPPALDVCVHDLIEHQVQIRPKSQAVCAWDGIFTYEEFNQRANSLATRLIKYGAGYGSFVPLMFEKSKWQAVSLLAILKSGAAFVALEHTIPDGRISIMLKQFEVMPLVLASKTQRARFEHLVDKILVVDEDSTSIDIPGVSLPGSGDVPKVPFNSPAYAIFTSGTTGTPKGAIIEHRQLSTSMQALNDKIGATSDMRMFQMTAYNFDLSISEIFCPMLCGGCVTIPSEWARFNDLASAFDSLDSNFGSFSPSFLATLSEKEFPKMKSILLAGERVSADLSNFWTRHGRRVVHMYGPTECTVGCCFLDTNFQAHYDGFIGDAYASRVWVVDPETSEKLMPIGAPGELVVEGPIVGSHYLGDPERTKNTFIVPPKWFSTICHRSPSRFYKTGDLGRLTSRGSFEIIGRKDTQKAHADSEQTKIRGLRVEIQEIEHQIQAAAEPKVGVAVEVRNPEAVPGQEILVAFLEMKDDKEPQRKLDLKICYEDLKSSDSLFSRTVSHIQPKLKDVLPSYMIPSTFIPVTSLPFSNSYKLNRSALKELANALSMSEVHDVVSGRNRKQSDQNLTQDEQTIRDLWAAVLQMSPDCVDIQDDFFYIGGDSLKAMALISAARRKGFYFTVAYLYKARNIRNLLQMLHGESKEGSSIAALSLIEKSSIAQLRNQSIDQCSIADDMIQDIMPVTDMQHWYLKHQLTDRRSWRVPVTFDLSADIDISRLQRAWDQLMARHPILRTRFVNASSGIFQVVLKHENVVWRTGTNEDDLMQALQAMDLSFGHRSYSCAVLKGHDQRPRRLIWYINHALSDRIMDEHVAQELSLLYRGHHVSLPRRSPFKNVLQHLMRCDSMKSEAFWKTHFDGVSYGAIFEQSTTSTEPFANAQLFYKTSIKPLSQKTKLREYSVIVTALALAISRSAAVDNIPFNLLHTGRTSAFSGGEDVMGPLLTRVPMRVCVKPSQSPISLLRIVDDSLASCLEHDIINEEEFRNVSQGAADHLSNAIVLNIQPPLSGLVIDSDSLFFPSYDPRHGLGHRTYRFSVNVTFEGVYTVFRFIWKQESIGGENVQRVVKNLEDLLGELGSVAG